MSSNGNYEVNSYLKSIEKVYLLKHKLTVVFSILSVLSTIFLIGFNLKIRSLEFKICIVFLVALILFLKWYIKTTRVNALVLVCKALNKSPNNINEVLTICRNRGFIKLAKYLKGL